MAQTFWNILAGLNFVGSFGNCLQVLWS